MLSVKLPEVPVTVTVNVPVVAAAEAARVSVLMLLAGLALKAAVTPVGSPEAESVTLAENPFAGVIVIVLVVWLPCTTLTLLGLADSVKLGARPTVNWT